jgi:hypothetical protein
VDIVSSSRTAPARPPTTALLVLPEAVVADLARCLDLDFGVVDLGVVGLLLVAATLPELFFFSARAAAAAAANSCGASSGDLIIRSRDDLRTMAHALAECSVGERVG